MFEAAPLICTPFTYIELTQVCRTLHIVSVPFTSTSVQLAAAVKTNGSVWTSSGCTEKVELY